MQIYYYPSADEDIYNIWKITCQKWSIQQADEYISGLYKTIMLTAQKDKHWRQLLKDYIADITTNNIYYVNYKRHYLFFKEFENNAGIGIIAVLHERMDIPNKIKEKII